MLKSIPTFSIVTDLDYLFDPTTGIYVNAYGDGRDWEREASVELIYPDGTTGFQIDAGIRIRGGYSRSSDNPKHAFRLLFRSEYGDSKLEYPLFGAGGMDVFDKDPIYAVRRTTRGVSTATHGTPWFATSLAWESRPKMSRTTAFRESPSKLHE